MPLVFSGFQEGAGAERYQCFGKRDTLVYMLYRKEKGTNLTTIKIELPDEQAEALKAKAAAEGLSVEDWLRRRVEQETRLRKGRYSRTELVEKCDPTAPLSNEDREWLDSPSVGREAL
jgi:hypothetical protein